MKKSSWHAKWYKKHINGINYPTSIYSYVWDFVSFCFLERAMAPARPPVSLGLVDSAATDSTGIFSTTGATGALTTAGAG